MKGLRCCVVGGGMLGLSMARSLSLAGASVDVWESETNIGGLAATWRIGDTEWDRFYHVITSNDRYLLDLLQAIDLEPDIRWSSPQTGFYADRRLHRFSSVIDFARFAPLNPIDKFRLGTTILSAARITDPLPLESITAVDWLTGLSGPKVTEKIWLPLLRAKLGVNAERVSAAFIWAIIARMYGARRGRGKRELFGYVPGGYRRILNRLQEHLRELGVAFHLNDPVRLVSTVPGGGIDVHSTDAVGRYDFAVVTVPAPIAASICSDLTPSERARLSDIEYQGVVCASVLLKRPLSPYYIMNITDRMPFTAVIEMDALVDRAYLNGHALIYLPKYVPSDDPVFDADDESIRHEFVAAVNRIRPDFGMHDVLAFRVSRARYVLPISTLGYSARIPPFTTSAQRLFVVNSTQIVNGTLNVNQTLELSNTAFSRIHECVEQLSLRHAVRV